MRDPEDEMLREARAMRERIALLEAKVNRIAPERDLARAELEDVREQRDAARKALALAEAHVELLVSERDAARQLADSMGALRDEAIARVAQLEAEREEWRRTHVALEVKPVEPWTPILTLACGCTTPSGRELVNTIEPTANCKTHGDQPVVGFAVR